MSPSRGLNLVLRSRLGFGPVRSSFRRYSEFVKSATNLSNKTQVYLSRIPDPFLNLSIEHYLLQKTPPDSTVLFLYTNEPCIVIGRNQNPWVEVNTNEIQQRENPIWLVRRRSGGGTVFHDEGNVNYSVIGPTAAFNRDKHAEMVVRALHELGVDKTRVNERHDIVLDKTHANGDTKAWKVSGSAYKLTRMRSLHHGTCLLNSPNLRDIRGYLHPYAAHCIEARGVASVSSPVCNVEVPNSQFEQAVVFEFAKMYGPTEPVIVRPTNGMMAVPEIGKGYDELRSPEWIYQQTPQFVFSDPQVDLGLGVTFTARNGIIMESDIKLGKTEKDDQIANHKLMGRKLHEVQDWDKVLGKATLMNTHLPTHYLNEEQFRHLKGIPDQDL